MRFLPAHVNESTDPVDNLGGVLSMLTVVGLVLGINFLPVPSARVAAVADPRSAPWCSARCSTSASAASTFPLYDLVVAARRLFWVAALGGIIVFGSLMGAMFIGQQFLQNVLGYDTLEAGAAILPAVFMMVLAAPRSAKLVQSHGSRFTLLLGYGFCLLGFVTMLVLWDEGIHYWAVALAYALIGTGVGLRRHTRIELVDGLGTRHQGRYGLRHRRPPA